MGTYTAVICVPADGGALLHVSVLKHSPGLELAMAEQEALPAVPLPVRAADPDRYAKAGEAAAGALSGRGWNIRGTWWASDNGLYAEAAPAPGNPLYSTWTGRAQDNPDEPG